MKIASYAVLLLSMTASTAVSDGFRPPHGFVPDAATATTIARAVLIPIYGAAQVKSEEPLVARRNGDMWIISGTLACSPYCLGGTATVSLSVSDGRVISVFHTK